MFPFLQFLQRNLFKATYYLLFSYYTHTLHKRPEDQLSAHTYVNSSINICSIQFLSIGQ